MHYWQVYAKLPVEVALKTGKKRFHKINIEISNICNLQCSFCPEVIRAKKVISVELFEKILVQAAPLTELVCFHLMGEPLVHPKLDQLLSLCEKYQARVFFVSNGVLLTEKRAELLLSPALHQVNFSLHSFQDNFPQKNPDEYLEKIFSYTEAALEQRPDLYLNYRLWNLNEPGQDRESNQRIRKKVEERFHFKIDETIDVRVEKSKRVKGRLYLHFDTEFIWPSLDLPTLGQQGTCHGLSSHIGILVDGTVVPCCLDKEGNIPLGNLLESPLEAILESPKARGILKGFKERKLVETLCQKCNYITRFGT